VDTVRVIVSFETSISSVAPSNTHTHIYTHAHQEMLWLTYGMRVGIVWKAITKVVKLFQKLFLIGSTYQNFY